jgi:hypothetical protein
MFSLGWKNDIRHFTCAMIAGLTLNIRQRPLLYYGLKYRHQRTHE